MANHIDAAKNAFITKTIRDDFLCMANRMGGITRNIVKGITYPNFQSIKPINMFNNKAKIISIKNGILFIFNDFTILCNI